MLQSRFKPVGRTVDCFQFRGRELETMLQHKIMTRQGMGRRVTEVVDSRQALIYRVLQPLAVKTKASTYNTKLIPSEQSSVCTLRLFYDVTHIVTYSFRSSAIVSSEKQHLCPQNFYGNLHNNVRSFTSVPGLYADDVTSQTHYIPTTYN